MAITETCFSAGRILRREDGLCAIITILPGGAIAEIYPTLGAFLGQADLLEVHVFEEVELAIEWATARLKARPPYVVVRPTFSWDK